MGKLDSKECVSGFSPRYLARLPQTFVGKLKKKSQFHICVCQEISSNSSLRSHFPYVWGQKIFKVLQKSFPCEWSRIMESKTLLLLLPPFEKVSKPCKRERSRANTPWLPKELLKAWCFALSKCPVKRNEDRVARKANIFSTPIFQIGKLHGSHLNSWKKHWLCGQTHFIIILGF